MSKKFEFKYLETINVKQAKAGLIHFTMDCFSLFFFVNRKCQKLQERRTLVGRDLAVRPVGKQLEIISGKCMCDIAQNPPVSSVHTNDMADAIRYGRKPEVTGENGRIALAVSIAALESIETGNVVKLSNL